MDFFLSLAAWISAGMIFALRVTDMSLDTLRVLFVMRGKKPITWFLGFFQASIFIIAITSVIQDINNPLSVVGYAAGNVVGMLIEERLAIGHIFIRIISSRQGPAITKKLRNEGYAVTAIPAFGKDGTVFLLNCSVLRKNVDRVQKIVNQVDPEAFITAEDIRPVRRGFWRA
ncbi:MAG: DUF2179 domain-containing protein [Anaerolineales bacterium]